MSITVTLDLGNEGARVALKELKDFGEYMNSKMAGEVADPGGTAALGWVMGDKIRRAIESAVKEQDRKFAQEAVSNRPAPPSIRERRLGVRSV